MNQSSTNEAYNLLSLAGQILTKAKEQAKERSVKADLKEVWDILQMLGLRPAAIGSSAAELRKLLITGHIAEARRIFLNPPPATASMEEKNRAFKDMCDNLAAAMKPLPPPAPSIKAPPVSNEVTCAVISLNDPFVNLPKGCVPYSGATLVEQFEDDGIEPMEVSEDDLQDDESPEIPANDCATDENPPQTLVSPRDQAVVERFFGGREQARKFGFAPHSKKAELSSEALMAEMESVSPPHAHPGFAS